jgi:hypothetical protein
MPLYADTLQQAVVREVCGGATDRFGWDNALPLGLKIVLNPVPVGFFLVQFLGKSRS